MTREQLEQRKRDLQQELQRAASIADQAQQTVFRIQGGLVELDLILKNMDAQDKPDDKA